MIDKDWTQRNPIPEFLRRTPGDSEPPRETKRKRWTSRNFQAAQRRAAETKRRERRLAERARERAMAQYRKVFGDSAPEPDKGAAEQRLVFEEALANERIRLRGGKHGG